MEYIKGDKADIDTENDVIHYSNIQEQIVFSIGLARSVKIDEIEKEVEREVSEIHGFKFNHRNLNHKNGAIECREKLASLYRLCYKITCSDLLEPPSFLWESGDTSKLWNIFQKTNSHLDLKTRMDFLSEKLELPQSYWTLENDHYKAKNGWWLEIYILILIAIEIILSLLDRSSTWREFTIEEFIGKIWKQLMIFFGIKEYPVLSSEYELFEETIILKKKKEDTKS